jgi:hypothetical protein
LLRKREFDGVTEIKLHNSIFDLFSALKLAYCGQPPVLLIDEVDAPINYLVLNPRCSDDDRKDAFKLMTTLLTVSLKLAAERGVIQMGLATGILPIVLKDISTASLSGRVTMHTNSREGLAK